MQANNGEVKSSRTFFIHGVDLNPILPIEYKNAHNAVILLCGAVVDALLSKS
jgi:hypothetical protein